MTTVSTDVSEDMADIVMKGDERCAFCRGQLVWLKSHNNSIILSKKEDHMQLKTVSFYYFNSTVIIGISQTIFKLREMVHENLNVFVGLVLEGSMPISVWRFCSKGSLQVQLYKNCLINNYEFILQDILMNVSIKIDWFFKYSLIRDLTNVIKFYSPIIKTVYFIKCS